LADKPKKGCEDNGIPVTDHLTDASISIVIIKQPRISYSEQQFDEIIEIEEFIPSNINFY
jgi:hypothetical protein